MVSPSVDGDVLAVLAGGARGLTGRAVHQLVPAALRTVQLALDRLVRQGIVIRESVGNSHLYRLNEEHLAAPWIVKLASLRLELIDALRRAIEAWEVQPEAGMLFGSVARGDATAESDLDILLVRPSAVDPDNEQWRVQLDGLARAATAWTGNDTRIVEFETQELLDQASEPVIREALLDGVDLAGSLRGVLGRRRRRA